MISAAASLGDQKTRARRARRASARSAGVRGNRTEMPPERRLAQSRHVCAEQAQ